MITPIPDSETQNCLELSGAENRRSMVSIEVGDVVGRSGNALRNVDALLVKGIADLSKDNPEYWAFSHGADRGQALSYFQYPAMMVPSLQRELLRLIAKLQPGVRHVLEPFAGSGTVVAESMYLGLSVLAQDINPLAVLLCKAKCGSVDHGGLALLVAETISRALEDRSTAIEASFSRRDKWFRPAAVTHLSRLRRAIRRVSETWARRFLWVSLAETIRLTSNSRTSTYKLHVRPPSEIAKLPSVMDVFRDVTAHNLDRFKSFVTRLQDLKRVHRKRYSQAVSVNLRDSRLSFTGKYHVLMTSPPYGDNTTTVPYGQSAYLPLQWIDLEDISAHATSDLLRTTHEIDRRSLGGVKRRGELSEEFRSILEMSPALSGVCERLKSAPRDRSSRVLAFVGDLERTVKSTADAMHDNAYMFWTLGNRRVGREEIPLDAILKELMSEHHVDFVHSIARRIPFKRMPNRNNVSPTMKCEHVLVFRKRPIE